MRAQTVENSPPGAVTRSDVPAGQRLGGRTLEHAAVRRESRPVQWAVPRALGVIPAQRAAEMRAQALHRAGHPIDGRDRRRLQPVAPNDALTFERVLVDFVCLRSDEIAGQLDTDAGVEQSSPR